MPEYQAGLNSLILALPGVSIIRSADEFNGDQTAKFDWKEENVSRCYLYHMFYQRYLVLYFVS